MVVAEHTRSFDVQCRLQPGLWDARLSESQSQACIPSWTSQKVCNCKASLVLSLYDCTICISFCHDKACSVVASTDHMVQATSKLSAPVSYKPSAECRVASYTNTLSVLVTAGGRNGRHISADDRTLHAWTWQESFGGNESIHSGWRTTEWWTGQPLIDGLKVLVWSAWS